MLTELGWALIWIEAALIIGPFIFCAHYWDSQCSEFKRTAVAYFSGHSVGIGLAAWVAAMCGAFVQ